MPRRLAIIVLLSLPLPVVAAVVDVRERVTVAEGSLVRLKDVASISDAEPIKAAALGEITLAPAPAAGRSQRLGFEDLRQRLQVHGVNLAEIELRGQSNVTVTTASKPPPPPPRPVAVPLKREVERPAPPQPAPRVPTRQEVEQANKRIETALLRVFRLTDEPSAPLSVRCNCDLSDVPLILTASTDQIRFAEPQLPVGAEQTVTAHWKNAAGDLQTVIVPVSVEVLPRRLAVRRAVPGGVPLQPDDLEWVSARLTPDAVTQLAEVVGKEATRSLREGTLLDKSMLAPVQLIRSNDIVTVQVLRPGIAVRRMFKATSSGALHDTVSLVAVDDPRLKIQAVVTGYHEATMPDPAASANASRGGPP